MNSRLYALEEKINNLHAMFNNDTYNISDDSNIYKEGLKVNKEMNIKFANTIKLDNDIKLDIKVKKLSNIIEDSLKSIDMKYQLINEQYLKLNNIADSQLKDYSNDINKQNLYSTIDKLCKDYEINIKKDEDHIKDIINNTENKVKDITSEFYINDSNYNN